PPAPAQPPRTASNRDPFAAMPRITPFTDFELDAVPAAPPPQDDDAAHGHRHRADDGGDDVLARILAREQN
ncbi:MAG: hypothetical protein ACRDVG_07390, partial [Jatrophihabitantaceae bacterium]